MYYYLLIVLQLCLAGPVILDNTQTPSRTQCLKRSQWEQGRGGNKYLALRPHSVEVTELALEV